MKIYNTLTAKKEELVPIKPGEVSIYACGPTVYNFFHIGNARMFVIFDTLRRYLEYAGYKVNFVQNFTDVDDKMIKKANEEGTTVKEIAEKYIKEYFVDAQGLNIKKATVHPRATENIDAIIELIEKLIEKGYAYEVSKDVYFNVEKDKEYGKLIHQDLDELQSGARIDVDERKKSPLDFALWKAEKPGEPSWESPWGKGRPGWHIECSAMSTKYLGKTIDIHGGAIDLIFPHHENEIAQSECANGCKFVNYWMHNAYINVDNKKMSKSLGNFFTVRDVSEKYDYNAIRFFILSAHYRSPLNFSDDLMKSAASGLQRIQTCVNNIEFALKTASGESVDSEFSGKLDGFKETFKAGMEDDLNTADAMAAIFDIVRITNSSLSLLSKGSMQYALDMIDELCGVLGIVVSAESVSLEDEVENMIVQRTEARKSKDFAKADEIRDKLKDMGVVLEDTPQGVKWRKA
ncbi:MAG: cysteine--tRNA ligase [Bacillota bacterium]|nr:cysteine--tRNA ligase [Bacillota bacterium]